MGLAGSTAASRWKIVWFTEYGMPPRASFSAAEASASMRRACAGWVAITTASKVSCHGLGAPCGGDVDAVGVPCTAVTGLESRMSGRVAATLST